MEILDLPLRRAPSCHLLTDVAVDHGEPRTFLVDSAASGTIVAPEAIPAALSDRIATLAEGRVHGASGTLPEKRRLLRAPLRLAGWELPEAELTVLDLSHLQASLGVAVSGILGLDVLGRGDLWLDFPALRLALSTGPEATALARKASASFLHQPFRESPEGMILLEVGLDLETTLPAVLDFGAATSILNRAASELPILAGATPGGPGGSARALGADSRGVPAIPRRLQTLRLGGVELAGALVYVADLPIFTHLGFSGPAMLLGLDILAERRLGLSFPEKMLFLSLDAAC